MGMNSGRTATAIMSTPGCLHVMCSEMFGCTLRRGVRDAPDKARAHVSGVSQLMAQRWPCKSQRPLPKSISIAPKLYAGLVGPFLESFLMPITFDKIGKKKIRTQKKKVLTDH